MVGVLSLFMNLVKVCWVGTSGVLAYIKEHLAGDSSIDNMVIFELKLIEVQCMLGIKEIEPLLLIIILILVAIYLHDTLKRKRLFRVLVYR